MNFTMNILKRKKVVLPALGVLLIAGGSFAAFGNGGDEPLDSTTTGEPTSATGLAAFDKNGDGIVYQDGMHPMIVTDEPGPSPDGCGMDLTPVRVDGSQEEGVVKIDPVTLQNIGVRTAPVTVEALGREVRTTGRFEPNEQQLAAVSPKIGGWVEKLYVEYVGARVRRGQPLLEIYSPELVSTQEEYLLALRNAERLGSASPDARRLVDAARRRLSYWDISDAQIRELENTGTPRKTLTLYAPASGTVTMKNVVEGQQIMPGQTLLQLADLSRLWLMVDVYEQDLSWVKTGTVARIELPYEPGRTITGKVDYIYDDLNPETRTIRARVSLPNPGLQLKPGMYATVHLNGGESQSLPVVPAEAIIRTGAQQMVILALGDGRFRPQPVTAGVEANAKVQILQGLQGGESVVTSAQFLIDSEARLQSAVGAMMAGMDMGSAASAGAHDHATPGAAATSGPQIEDGRQVVRVTVGANGFEPLKVELKAGTPARLIFTRTTNQTCAKQVHVPDFGIGKTDLPLNKPVTIDLKLATDGTFSFACGMDMLKGAVVVTS